MRPTLLSRIQGALLGVCIGDALGAPVETMKPHEIIAKLGPQGVTTFLDAIQIRIKESAKLKAGDTTDDWQLTRVIANSLVRSGAWNRGDCIAEHLYAFDTSVTGWGKSTRNALADIKSGKRDVHKPLMPIPGSGGGNGVIMKIAPLAIVAALYHLSQNKESELVGNQTRQEELKSHSFLFRAVVDLGSITHSDPDAWWTAFIVAEIMKRLLVSDEPYKVEDIRQELLTFCRGGKSGKYIPGGLQDSLKKVIRCPLGSTVSEIELMHRMFPPGFVATESMPLVLATLVRHLEDFRGGVLEAVNAGGDADTHASIVGALIGAHVGVEGIPQEWVSFRPEFQEALTLGEVLYKTFTKE